MKMGLTASPLRRRGCLLVLAFCVLVPFTLMMLFIGPGKNIYMCVDKLQSYELKLETISKYGKKHSIEIERNN